MQKRPDPRETRLKNLITALSQNKSVAGQQFSSNDDLREIGLLTMHFTDLEEAIALYCEILLYRPELGGFHHPKPVVEKGFSEKLDLFKTLVVAIGVLHTVGSDDIVQELDKARILGDNRNSIIHGYLHLGSKGLVFRNRQHETRADLTSLRNLTSQILQAHNDITQAVDRFYKQLVKVAPVKGGLEAAIISVLESHLQLIMSTIKLRKSHSERDALQRQVDISKKTLRNSQAQLRTAEMKLPGEYRKLLVKRRAQLKRCTYMANRIEITGVADPKFALANVKLSKLDKQLEALKVALLKDQNNQNNR
jgi:hypothetical protein